MMLADMGADVVRVDRPTAPTNAGVLGRNRRSIAVDLKADEGLSLLLELVGGRTGSLSIPPGVAERLGFGRRPATPRTEAGLRTCDGVGQEGPGR